MTFLNEACHYGSTNTSNVSCSVYNWNPKFHNVCDRAFFSTEYLI
ncbi:hypothetical protein HMPREF7215_2272 [Pyramidobacter piscolens W5455]|uniref:Uncharacterized protein n=1 Tax=Pyramidobacter piscolens W5455 TaxID=352165 RepID=A0ABM9ZU04_9BACT|nr:hypothetical protein HMPREF7215_2272 [Pyramidobacter piscolens W5455]